MKQKIKDLKFADKIEKMKGLELKERIQFAMDYKILSTIRPIPYLGKKDIKVKYEHPELVARCPMTKIMDLYTITIEYTPDEFIPELKSLKFYFLGYDQLPISHEHLLVKIFNDFQQVIKPKWLKTTLSVAIRGGIKTEIIREEKFTI